MSIIFPEIIKQISALNDIQKKILEYKDSHKVLYTSTLHGSSKSILTSSIFGDVKNILMFFPTIQQVKETKVELDVLGLGDYVVTLENIDNESLQESLTKIGNQEKTVFISLYDLLSTPLPAKEDIDKNRIDLNEGTEIAYDNLIEYLNLYEYTREKFVDMPGLYSIRGSIIDFWSYSDKHPCRLEFDGDFIESVRYFDPDSQRSSVRIETVSLAPRISIDRRRDSSIFDYFDEPIVFVSKRNLVEFGIEETPFDPSEEGQPADDLDEELKKELFEGKMIEESPAAENERSKINGKALLEHRACWIVEEELPHLSDSIKLDIYPAPAINSNYEILFNVLSDFASKNFRIIVTTENELQGKRLFDLFSDFKDELRDLLESGKIKINVIPIKEGFLCRRDKLLILSDYQIFNKPFRTQISHRQKHKKSRVKDFATIKKGDFVVHENFGIGQYAGLETIRIGMVEQESIKILYADGGIVYVNLNYLGLVKKYSSKENVPPRLSALGSNEWKTTKKKVKSKIKDAARELIKLYAQRKTASGFAFSQDSIWQRELEASFFYEDTPDQSKVTEEVKIDMESDNPMDRLVCGDVGFGKTEIAVRASFKAVNDNKQVALLVPTTILAEQHFNTFNDRLSQFPVKIEALSRFQSKAEQKKISEDLANGKVDIVIGTHRLLSKDIDFKDLGLLIVDEEHRFGVMAKERLRRIKTNVDTLVLTATPIPRTLNLSLLGARDLSIIATPPPNRQPIYTKVETFNIQNIREWILKEISRGGQVYFVHDRIHSIEKIAAYIQKYIPEVNIGIAHGQMKPSQLEDVIHDFLNRKYHVLVSTKIIESGLDIPNVNTIIINRADKFGLAELHQLRGRVGRSDRQAYAYLIVPSLNTITKKAVRRLQAIEEYTELGEGFSLSMRDLEIRGAGNLLGTEQSGAIDSVGFDLYLKLLDEAVEELKQSEFQDVFKELPKVTERSAPTIDTYFEIGIPDSYMPDQSDRLGFYSALFSMIKIDELPEIIEEMEDRFGKMPIIIKRLVMAAELRFYASVALFERIVIQRDKIVIQLPKADREDYYRDKFTVYMQFLVKNYHKEVNFRQEKNSMKLDIKNSQSSPENSLKYLIGFVKESIDVLEKIETQTV